MKKKLDYQKELCRGTLKQIMKVRGLRTISFANYNKWRADNNLMPVSSDIHSLKIDIQDGYLNAFGYRRNNGLCGDKIDPDANVYTTALDIVNNILSSENAIPYSVRKNILVKMSR